MMYVSEKKNEFSDSLRGDPVNKRQESESEIQKNGGN